MVTCRTYTIEKAPTPGFTLTADQYEGIGPFDTTLHISYSVGAGQIVRIVNSDPISGDSCLTTDIPLDGNGDATVPYSVTGTHTIYVIKTIGTGGENCCTSFSQTLCQYSNYITFTVTPPTLASIEISSPITSINAEDTLQFTVICKDTNNGVMTCPILTWNSTNVSKGTIDSTGLLTGISQGTTDITASSGSTVSNSITISVSAAVQALTTIYISPPSASVSINGTRQFITTCKDQNSTIMTCPTLIWEVSDTNVGSISNTGLFTGLSVDTVTVTAKVGIIIGSAVVTVTEQACTPSWQCDQPLNGYETDLNDCTTPNRRLNSVCNPSVGGGITGDIREGLMYLGLNIKYAALILGAAMIGVVMIRKGPDVEIKEIIEKK